MSESLFVGWPLDAPDADGHFDYAAGADCLREALWTLLLTNPGERLMRPSFGAGLRQWIGQPNTQSTRQLIAASVTTAIGVWEQRISLGGVAVIADPADPAAVVITITYTARGATGAPPAQLTLSVPLGGG